MFGGQYFKVCFFDFVPFVRKYSRNTTHKTADFPRAHIYGVMRFTRNIKFVRALWRLPVIGDSTVDGIKCFNVRTRGGCNNG